MNKELFLNKVDYYIYYEYNKNYLDNMPRNNNIFLTAPYFYFRNNFLINNNEINLYKENKFIKLIKNYDKRYLFLVEGNGFIRNPEFLSEKDLSYINNILNDEPYNFYGLSAYIIYNYNKVSLNLGEYFKKFFKIEPNNPHMLVRLARYQASTLYKKYNYDKKYLFLGKENILKAIGEFKKYKKENEIPTFFHSWLGFIEQELGNNKEAIRLYDYTIYLNKKILVDIPEPFVWKGFSLNRLGKYKESLELLLTLEKDNKINKYNNKRDFRLYKVISDNYYNLCKYNLFYKNLKITIKKFLEVFSFHFNDGKYILDKNNYKIIFNSIIYSNGYSSFLSYNEKYLNDYLDYIILSIAFLYKERLLGKNISFNDSRGIEKLCFNYLKIIYDGKI